MLLPCTCCGVRCSVRNAEGDYLCGRCRRAGSTTAVAVAEAPVAGDRVRRPLVVACEKRARERAGEQRVDRQLVLCGIPAAAAAAIVGAFAVGPIAFVSVVAFVIYLWALRKLATALRGDYAPVGTCALLAGLMMTMQAVSLVLLGAAGTGTALAAVAGGIFVFGVLVRYRLRLSMKNALLLTVLTGVETFVITVVFAAAIQSTSDGFRWL